MTKSKTRNTYRCRWKGCTARPFPHAQAVRAHRVKVHGEAWTRDKDKAPRKTERRSTVVTELPTVPMTKVGRTSTRRPAKDPFRVMAKVIPTDVLLEALRERVRR